MLLLLAANEWSRSTHESDATKQLKEVVEFTAQLDMDRVNPRMGSRRVTVYFGPNLYNS